VPVDSFYEWKKTATGKQPYAIALADRRLMALAGLWENWRSPAGEWVRTFARNCQINLPWPKRV
jgi:putative SOS response-associated peptidase YedK